MSLLGYADIISPTGKEIFGTRALHAEEVRPGCVVITEQPVPAGEKVETSFRVERARNYVQKKGGDEIVAHLASREVGYTGYRYVATKFYAASLATITAG